MLVKKNKSTVFLAFGFATMFFKQNDGAIY